MSGPWLGGSYHDEDKVHAVQDVLNGGEGGAGVEYDSGLATEILDLVDGAVEVDGGGLLSMDADDVGSGLR